MKDTQKNWDDFFAKWSQSQPRLALEERISKALFGASDILVSDEMSGLRKRILSSELQPGDGALARKLAMDIALRLMRVGDAIDELAAFDEAHK